MAIDDRALRTLLAARGAVAKMRSDEAALEAAMPESVLIPDADAIMHDVVRRLQALPEGEKGDPVFFDAALNILTEHADQALRRYRPQDASPFTRDEHAALEAVVKADGTRPSLPLRRGEANPDHPLAGGWKKMIVETRDRIRTLAAAVGRIEPSRASATNYFGTGWVVDSNKGLVLTNRHVMDAFLRRATTLYEPHEDGFRTHDGVFIDFDCETGVETVNRFRVVAATPARAAGPEFADLDAAVLRIEPVPGPGGSRTDVPQAVSVRADKDAVGRGTLPSMCIVGFPGPPPARSGISMIDGHGQIDWAWVDGVLFGGGGKYGLKRLAPGTVDRMVHSLPGDRHGWIFGHEATTLGGNSGSPAFAWEDNEGGYAFGLHFWGDTLVENRAHAVAGAADGLRRLGVPVVDDQERW